MLFIFHKNHPSGPRHILRVQLNWVEDSALMAYSFSRIMERYASSVAMGMSALHAVR